MPMGIDRLFAMASAARSTLDPKSIHAWALSRRPHLPSCDVFLSLLSADEQERASMFRTPQLRAEFVISRTLLRILLAGYCTSSPNEVRFSYGQNGKPRLENRKGTSTGIAFNMSHSEDIVLIAIAAGTNLGVDVEHLQMGSHYTETIADACLDPYEATLLAGVSPDRRTHMLLRYWTHKEAYLKAVGCGLSIPPRQVSVRFLNSSRSLIRGTYLGGRPPMFGRDLACGEDYVAAVVAPDRLQELAFLH